MTHHRYSGYDVRFKPEADNTDPFPPSFYETERNAKAKLAQMMQPPKSLQRS